MYNLSQSRQLSTHWTSTLWTQIQLRKLVYGYCQVRVRNKEGTWVRGQVKLTWVCVTARSSSSSSMFLDSWLAENRTPKTHATYITIYFWHDNRRKATEKKTTKKQQKKTTCPLWQRWAIYLAKGPHQKPERSREPSQHANFNFVYCLF